MEDTIEKEQNVLKKELSDSPPLLWHCVIKESLSTYLKIFLKFKILVLASALITFILLATTGMIYILTNIENYLETLITIIINLLGKLTQYFITTPMWIWIIIAGIWTLIGIIPLYSYIKCNINVLPTKLQQERLKGSICWYSVLGAFIGIIIGTICGCIATNPYTNSAIVGIWIIFGILIGSLFGALLPLLGEN